MSSRMISGGLAVAAVIVGIYWFRDILTPFALAVFLWLVIDGLLFGGGHFVRPFFA